MVQDKSEQIMRLALSSPGNLKAVIFRHHNGQHY